MKIVADTNIYLAIALNESERENIIALTVGHDLVAPEILPFEIANALSAMVKRHRLTINEVLPVFDIIEKIPVEFRKINFRHAIQIALDYNIYTYDAYWLEYARNLSYPILTLDKKMKAVAKNMGLKILEVDK